MLESSGRGRQRAEPVVGHDFLHGKFGAEEAQFLARLDDLDVALWVRHSAGVRQRRVQPPP